MNKAEIIERVVELYNEAAERGDIYFENALHGLLIDAGTIESEQLVYPKLDRIQEYKIIDLWLIAGYTSKTVCLYLAINNDQRAYLTCEGSGGAVVLWYEDPSNNYEDRMSLIWNLTEQKHGAGYITEPAGAFDQWIFPVDTITEDDDFGRTDAENELYQFIAQLAEMLC